MLFWNVNGKHVVKLNGDKTHSRARWKGSKICVQVSARPLRGLPHKSLPRACTFLLFLFLAEMRKHSQVLNSPCPSISSPMSLRAEQVFPPNPRLPLVTAPLIVNPCPFDCSMTGPGKSRKIANFNQQATITCIAIAIRAVLKWRSENQCQSNHCDQSQQE